VQNFVTHNYSMFKWMQTDNPTGFECAKPGEKGKLNVAQEMSYHYMNPNNRHVDILLNHSAGAGKTVTMMLICSVFMRDGYMPIIVTKINLMAGYLKSAFEQNADVNIQQYLRMKSVTTVRELVARERKIKFEQVTREEVLQRGRSIWSEMGLPSFSENNQLLTYQKFSNTAEAYRSGGTNNARLQSYEEEDCANRRSPQTLGHQYRRNGRRTWQHPCNYGHVLG
jgi:hypothetical protein